ncbi:hypothetical protein PR048_033786 [Dryococelus australis]|uniref:Uncharacterized protein n=1 Tax=Dryococelus australis TaxID=614101 RepID=A0ABQ9FZ17_9NEOP|nr:hypothetical protein PR048_033786 [Dryococelus australis]
MLTTPRKNGNHLILISTQNKESVTPPHLQIKQGVTQTPQQIILQQITKGTHHIIWIHVTLNHKQNSALVDRAASHNIVLVEFIHVSEIRPANQVCTLLDVKTQGKQLEKRQSLSTIGHGDHNYCPCVGQFKGTRHNLLLSTPWLIEHNTIVETAACTIQSGQKEKRTLHPVQLDGLDPELPESYLEIVQKILHERRDVFVAADMLR